MKMLRTFVYWIFITLGTSSLLGFAAFSYPIKNELLVILIMLLGFLVYERDRNPERSR